MLALSILSVLTNYNCDLALATIPVQITLMVYYFATRYLPTRQSRSFVAVLVVSLLMTVSDIVSSVLVSHGNMVPIGLLYGSTVAYYMLLVLLSWLLFSYVAEEIHAYRMISSRFRLITKAPLFFMLALVAVSPGMGIIFSFDGNGQFQLGPAYVSLYLFQWFYALLAVAYVHTCRETLHRIQRRRLYAYNILIFVGTFLAALDEQILIISYFYLLAILVIFLGAQNPESFYETRLDAFNSRGFRSLMAEALGEQKYWLIGIAIKDYSGVRELYGDQQMDGALRKMGQFFHQLVDRRTSLFYIRNGRFILLSHWPLDEDKLCQIIHERFQSAWHSKDFADIFLSAGCVKMDRSVVFFSMAELIRCLRLAMDRAGDPAYTKDIHIDAAFNREIQRRVLVQQTLSNAIENDAVVMFLQPLVDAKTGAVVGAEALARLEGPDGGFIPPSEFIPLAEANGTISKLGEQIFAKACAFLSMPAVRKSSVEWINVNLSPLQCRDRTMPRRFIRIKDQFRLPSSALHLELTEEAMIQADRLQESVRIMREDGFQFALDDYGSGYSNAGRLLSIPFRTIKLDRSIVVAHFEKGGTYLEDIIHSLHNQGYEITAEGVEDKRMADELIRLGVDYLQGFFYARPMSEDDFLAYIRPKGKGAVSDDAEENLP